jgi:hypothetical protein
MRASARHSLQPRSALVRSVLVRSGASTGFLLGYALLSACTLITDVDREKIPEPQTPPFGEVDAGPIPEPSTPDASPPASLPDAGDGDAGDASVSVPDNDASAPGGDAGDAG